MGLQLTANEISSVANDPTYVLKGRIGAANLFRATEGTVTVSGEASGFEKENAYAEGFTFDFWKPDSTGEHWLKVEFSSVQKASYLGIAAHDMQNHGITDLQLEYSANDADWTVASDTFTPSTSDVLLNFFTEAEAKFWRVIFTCTTAPSLGAIAIGCALKLEAPIPLDYTPPDQRLMDKHLVERAEGGQFLGRSIVSQGAALNLQLTGVELSWIQTHWEPNVRLLEQYPFFWSAEERATVNGAEDGAFYGWATSQPASQFVAGVYGSISLSARGIVT